MQEVQDEKDAPDSIEEFLSFLNTLTSDIEVSLIQLCMHCRVGFRFEFKVQGHPNYDKDATKILSSMAQF